MLSVCQPQTDTKYRFISNTICMPLILLRLLLYCGKFLDLHLSTKSKWLKFSKLYLHRLFCLIQVIPRESEMYQEHSFIYSSKFVWFALRDDIETNDCFSFSSDSHCAPCVCRCRLSVCRFSVRLAALVVAMRQKRRINRVNFR